MTDKEALRMALEALESCGAGHITDGGNQWHDEKLVDKAITAIKQALAAPVQEPTIASCIIGADAVGKKIDGYEAAKVFAAMQKAMGTPPAAQPAVPLTDDTRRLDALAKNSWDLRCFDMSDDDIGWQVIEHHMQRPHERKLAEVFRDDPRQAIDAAIEAKIKEKNT